MVKKNVMAALAESQQRYMGHLAMEAYQYANVCVKHDPSALLPVVVNVNGMDNRIEDVAKITLGDDDNPDDQYRLYVYPLEIDYLLPIIEGVRKVHPEFEIDVRVYKSDDEEEEESTPQEVEEVKFGDKDFDKTTEKKEEKYVDDAPKYRYIVYTMPPVTKKLKDLYTDVVKQLSKITKGKFDVEKTKLSAKVAPMLVGYTKADEEKAKAMIDNNHSQYLEREKTLTDDKLKEIEEGYQFYCKRHPDQAAKEQSEVSGKDDPATGKEDDSKGSKGNMLKL